MAAWKNSRGNSSKKTSTDEMLEAENNRLVGNLASKVSRLKGIAIDIEKESKQQNMYIDGMGDDFDSTTGLLGGSVQRLSHMISSGRSNRKLCCYIIGFLVALFFILYYTLGRIMRWYHSSAAPGRAIIEGTTLSTACINCTTSPHWTTGS